eukprot:2206115-Amphidinium_carterae.1
MVSSLGDKCIYILQEATAHNNFRFFAQLCNLHGIPAQSSSPSSTTNGLRTLEVKIATIVNNLKGPMAQQLMLRINQQTTFDEGHQWISNYFN